MKKQTFKQSLIAALVLLLGVTALVGCDSDNGSDDSEPTTVATTAPAADDATEAPDAPTEADVAPNDSGADLFGDDNFTMEIPDGWTIEGSIIFAPNGQSNVNVLVEGMQGLSFDEYMDATFDALEAAFPDIYPFLENVFQVDGGRAGVVIGYVSDLIASDATYQFFIEVGDVVYVITYTSIGDYSLVDDVAAMVDTFVAR